MFKMEVLIIVNSSLNFCDSVILYDNYNGIILKNINKTVGILAQQSIRLLQGIGLPFQKYFYL